MSINKKQSFTEYNVESPQRDFALTFKDYNKGNRDQVNVTIDGVPAEALGHQVFRKNALTVALEPIVAKGDVRLQRETNIDDPFYKFTSGALFTPANIDQNFQQILHSQQEVRDGFSRLESNTHGVVEAAKQATGRANDAADRVDDLIVGRVHDKDVITWSGRTQESRNKDSVHVEDFRYNGGVRQSDQATMQDAVNHCIANNVSLNCRGVSIVSNSNIVGFWEVDTFGLGYIHKPDGVFHTKPKKQTNTLYVSTRGLDANDGLSSETPTTHKQVFYYLSTMSGQTLNGYWRVKYLEGEYSTNGVRVTSLPIFKNRLVIFGESVNSAINELPKVKFNGSNSASNYWFHCENNVNFLRASFRDIHISGYMGGGIIIWDAHNVINDNVHLSDMPTGAGYRNGYARHNNGKVSRCGQGIGFAYVQRGNIGTLSGGGVLFDDNTVSVNVSRSAVAYVQGSEFENVGNIGIEVNRNSRIRTQGNKFKSFSDDAVVAAYIQCSMSSTYNPDNDKNPDTYLGLTSTRKAYNQLTGGFHATLNRGTQETLHLVSNGQGLSVAGTDINLLSSQRPDYVPFRLPAYILYTDQFKIRCVLLARVYEGAGGTLFLNPAHSDEARYLAKIAIPKQPITKDINIEFVVYTNPESNVIRYDVNCAALGIFTCGAAAGTAIGGSGVRSMTDSTLLYRLLWRGISDAAVEFRSMRSYVEI